MLRDYKDDNEFLKKLDIISNRGLIYFEKKFYLSKLMEIMEENNIEPSIDNLVYMIKNEVTAKMDEEINDAIEKVIKKNIIELKNNNEII